MQTNECLFLILVMLRIKEDPCYGLIKPKYLFVHPVELSPKLPVGNPDNRCLSISRIPLSSFPTSLWKGRHDLVYSWESGTSDQPCFSSTGWLTWLGDEGRRRTFPFGSGSPPCAKQCSRIHPKVIVNLFFFIFKHPKLDFELYQPVSQGKLPFQAANYRWSHCSGKQPKPKRNLQDKLAPRSWSWSSMFYFSI